MLSWVVSDIQQKLELYHAHRVHVANQQKAIYKIEEEVKQECLENKIRSKHALVVIDWKMKYESMSARETSQEHFRKRGIAWHGCLLKFFDMRKVLQFGTTFMLTRSWKVQTSKIAWQLHHDRGISISNT